MRRHHLAVLLSVGVVTAAAPLHAQQSDWGVDRHSGTSLRVTTSNGQKHVGVLDHATQDSLLLRTGTNSIMLGRPAITALEVSAGTRSNVLRGMGIGTLIGTLGGGILGYAGGTDCTGGELICFTRSDTAAFGAFGGGLVGFVFGGIVGALSRSQKWQPVVTGGNQVGIQLHVQ